MAEGVYQFSVGTIECWVISDGKVERTRDWMIGLFDDAPAGEVGAAFDALEKPVYHHFNCFVYKIDGKYTLVDTGSGRGGLPVVGNLYDRLMSANITPEMIDTVIISHCHGDHINGLVDDEGNLVYPNANYLIHKAEWEHWMNDEFLAAMDEGRAAGLKKHLLPIQDKLTLIDSDKEIASGVTMMLMPGHTPGHIGLVLESDGEKLVHVVDIAHLLVQMPNPSWSPRFDTDKNLAAETRLTWFKKLSDDDTLTLFYHLPFPGVGHILPDGNGNKWQPV